MITRHALVPTSIGELTLTADGAALTGVYFPAHRYPPRAASLGDQVAVEADPLLSRAAWQLREYLAGERRDFELPLAPVGQDFSQQVWQILTRLPYGATTSYGAIASELGNTHLAQRVGQAVGHNPISIIIPCHRVLGADGSLTGYAGGLERKRLLLALEEPAASTAGRLF